MALLPYSTFADYDVPRQRNGVSRFMLRALCLLAMLS